METIKYLVGKDGAIKMETSGFSGETCLSKANEILGNLQQVGVNAGNLNRQMKPTPPSGVSVYGK